MHRLPAYALRLLLCHDSLFLSLGPLSSPHLLPTAFHRRDVDSRLEMGGLGHSSSVSAAQVLLLPRLIFIPVSIIPPGRLPPPSARTTHTPARQSLVQPFDGAHGFDGTDEGFALPEHAVGQFGIGYLSHPPW